MNRPGQLNLNELEIAILKRIASDNPDTGVLIRQLIATAHVLSREFSGVGCFSTIKYDESIATDNVHIGLETTIAMPHGTNGLGAVLFLENGQPAVLEIYTFGDEKWDGKIEAFSIA